MRTSRRLARLRWILPVSAAVALLGLALPATASAQHPARPLACRAVPAHVARDAKLSTRTTRAYRITPVSDSRGATCTPAVARLWRVPKGASSAVTRAPASECYNAVGRQFLHSNTVLQGWGRFQNCTGTVDCSVQADLQELSNTDGAWFTIKAGPHKFGPCNSTESVVSIDCYKQANSYTYHTLAIIIIYWSNGTATGPVDDYSAEISAKSSC